MFLTVKPHDPLIARDSRPFGSGGRARTMEWPLPGVLAGSIRTLLGKKADYTFTDAQVEQLKQVTMIGPFPFAHQQLYLPAPRDLLLHDNNGCLELQSLFPQQPHENEGCNLPHSALWPLHVDGDFKPLLPPPFWAFKHLAAWLSGQVPEVEKQLKKTQDKDNFPDQDFLAPLEQDSRTHVKMDSGRGATEESQLFMTSGLVFPDIGTKTSPAIEMLASVQTPETLSPALQALKDFHPVGGERRLAYFSESKTPSWPSPRASDLGLIGAKKVRLYLASSAFFYKGWIPDWLDENLQGSPPGSEMCLQLRGACVGKWQAVSGWCLQTKQPKALRRLVPAGSVYFFEVIEGNPESLASQCFQSVCQGQERLDGYGIALWGAWKQMEDQS